MPVFTRASSVFIPAVPALTSHVNAVLLMTTRIASMAYLASLTGMRRRAFADARPALAGASSGDALRLEHVMAGELHHEVARETVWALDDDRAPAIGHQPSSISDAQPIGHGVRTAHRRIVEGGDDLEAVRLRVCVDRRQLPLVAVLVRPDVRLP